MPTRGFNLVNMSQKNQSLTIFTPATLEMVTFDPFLALGMNAYQMKRLRKGIEALEKYDKMLETQLPWLNQWGCSAYEGY